MSFIGAAPDVTKDGFIARARLTAEIQAIWRQRSSRPTRSEGHLNTAGAIGEELPRRVVVLQMIDCGIRNHSSDDSLLSRIGEIMPPGRIHLRGRFFFKKRSIERWIGDAHRRTKSRGPRQCVARQTFTGALRSAAAIQAAENVIWIAIHVTHLPEGSGVALAVRSIESTRQVAVVELPGSDFSF